MLDRGDLLQSKPIFPRSCETSLDDACGKFT